MRNHKRMPQVMLFYADGCFFILGNEVPRDKIIGLKGGHEFGRTGTIYITTVETSYKLYGVKNYAKAIKEINSIVKGQ